MSLPAEMDAPPADDVPPAGLRPKPDRKTRRPLSVTITGAVVLSQAAFYWTRFILALVNWDFLHSLRPVLPLRLAISGAVWGALFAISAWRLWRGLRYGREFALALALLFLAYDWLERTLLAANRDWNVNWQFALGVNLVWLAWLAWTFSRRRVRSFFERENERNSER